MLCRNPLQKMMVKDCQSWRVCNALEEAQMKGAALILEELLGRWRILLGRNQKHSFSPLAHWQYLTGLSIHFNQFTVMFRTWCLKKWDDKSEMHIAKAVFNQICTIFHCVWSFALKGLWIWEGMSAEMNWVQWDLWQHRMITDVKIIVNVAKKKNTYETVHLFLNRKKENVFCNTL